MLPNKALAVKKGVGKKPPPDENDEVKQAQELGRALRAVGKVLQETKHLRCAGTPMVPRRGYKHLKPLHLLALDDDLAVLGAPFDLPVLIRGRVSEFESARVLFCRTTTDQVASRYGQSVEWNAICVDKFSPSTDVEEFRAVRPEHGFHSALLAIMRR